MPLGLRKKKNIHAFEEEYFENKRTFPDMLWGSL